MKKFLVVQFDRYDTNKSKHKFVEADSHVAAMLESGYADEESMKQHWGDGGFEQVTDAFSCIAGEEEDILCYLLP